ncbi:SDR family NAD(P)-dependent oxidoreductase [Variovorax terrae]|uniref:SDR family oxidoreductase n=1 Tax=Variovorax terrae TaxID=2923278 RepID=A0A9X1VYD0_9BURK|nr:SDR family oxidoreductase [Variovorax terrae]MCJ0764399.1 SDR family oxidoreductase [Variovorax terrae]
MATSAWQGTTAIVTGAGSGIGRALTLALARRGVQVVATDVNDAAVQQVAAEGGASVRGEVLDVRSADAVRAIVEATVDRQGRLDYLLNNAGMAVGGETDDIQQVAWERILDVNLRGVIHGVLAAYPQMLKQGFGHIVNTASLAGLVPGPLLTPYAMTKHAVVGLSTSLRIEAATRGVRVSALCPAAIETPLLDSKGAPDLPAPIWVPDMRRFLTRLAGPPHPVAAFAEEALDAIERNQAIIVVPGRARVAWRLARLFPGLVERLALSAVQAERADR